MTIERGVSASQAGRLVVAVAMSGCGAQPALLAGGDGASADTGPSEVDGSDSDEMIAAEGPDAGSSATEVSNGLTPPNACPNAWLQPDVGCPSPSDFGAVTKFCGSLGLRCLFGPSPPDLSLEAVNCELPSNPAGLLWTFQGRIYEPAGFDSLPHEIVLDASDCVARGETVCECPGGADVATTEAFLNNDASLWVATYGNPQAYVAFTDDGCAARVRYGDETPATADYASKLMAAYAGRRWSCATSGTHLVMFHTMQIVGPP